MKILIIFLVLIFSTKICFSIVNLDSGVANYMFSGNANDISGYGNNGTVSGARLTNDRFGNPNSAYLFDGVSDYISAPNTPSLRVEKSITISAWIKTSDPQPDLTYPNSGWGYIIGLNCTNGSGSYAILVSRKFMEVEFGISPHEDSETNFLSEYLFYYCNIYNSKWHHIISIYEYYSGFLKLYIDGHLEATDYWGNYLLKIIDYLPLLIGGNHNRGPCRIGRQYFQGCIDDIRIYNRALNDDEVAALYQYPQPFTDHNTDMTVNVSNNSPLCEGSVLNLKAVGDTSLEYSWTGPNGFTSKEQNPVINKISKNRDEGTYTLTVTNHDTCYIKQYTTDVKIGKSPDVTISGVDSICDGESVILSASPEYNDYKWSTGETTQKITINKSGDYTVTITDSLGCSASKTFHVFSKDNSNSTLSFGIVKKLTFDSVNYGASICKNLEIKNISNNKIITYGFPLKFNVYFSIPQSIFPLTLLPNETKTIQICFKPDSMGYFEDEISIGNECGYSKLALEGNCIENNYYLSTNCAVDIKLKTSDVIKKKIVVSVPFPNPATDKIYLPFSAIPEAVFHSECSIYNSIGEKIQSGKLEVINKSILENKEILDCRYEFDTEKLQSGIYFVVLKSEFLNISMPVVVQK